MTAYFGYERDFARRWCPVIYRSKPDEKSVNGQGVERSPIVVIPPTIDLESDPFAQLTRLYPPPKDDQP